VRSLRFSSRTPSAPLWPFRFAGIPRRVGYSRDARGLLLTTRVAPPPRGVAASTVDYYCDLVERGLGIPVPDRRPRLALTDSERAAADAVMEGVRRPYALLVPGGNNPAKRWAPDRFAAVAEWLHRERGMSVVASGSPGEREVLAAIAGQAAVPVTNLAERSIELGALKGIVAGAAIVITNDTGPRHFAAAFGVPTVALFGPTDHRWTRLPGVPERVLIAEPFLPDELIADDRAAFCSIDRIAVGDVIAAASSLLAN
jgi:heptosyltransferase-2